MNCPYCSIHNLRGPVGLKAHIRYSHKELLQTPIRTVDLKYAEIIQKAEDYERRARNLRHAAEILVEEKLIGEMP